MKTHWLRGLLLGVSMALVLSASAAAVIYAQDQMGPVISCPADVTIECDESSDPSNTGQATASGDCGTIWVTYTDEEYLTGCNGTGDIKREWTAMDECGSSSCVQTITVVDTTPPVVSCPADVTIECGESSHPDDTGWASATDNCGTPSVTYADVEYPGGCNGTGDIEREWTATDDCENWSSCVQMITVLEQELEQEFVPEPGSILLLGSGLAGLAGYATLRWRTRE